MTQLELAQQSHITESYCGRLERGETSPGIDLVDRLATALGTTAADLLPATETPDTLAVLRGQAKNLFETILQSGDRDTFLALNPFLAKLAESSARGH
jgi:transcriptional regulator with XRE-family HTH domain